MSSASSSPSTSNGESVRAASRDEGGPKERLLEAAERILQSQGYAAITTRRLAREADLNQALVHYHFGSIDHVMMRLLERVGERSDTVIEAAFAEPGNAMEQMRDHLSTVYDVNVRSGLAKVWFELIAMGANDPAMRPVIHTRFDQVLDQYSAHVRPIFDEANVSDDEQVEGISALIQAMSYGILLQKVVGYDRGHRAMLRIVDQLLDQATSVSPPTTPEP